MLSGTSCLLMPVPLVALPCGSMSMSRVRFSATASAAARLTAVVVLPTPPFWLATAMILPTRRFPREVQGRTARCPEWRES